MKKIFLSICAAAGAWGLLGVAFVFGKVATTVVLFGHSFSQATILAVCAGLVGLLCYRSIH